MVNELAHVTTFRTTTLMIKHKQLKANPNVSKMIGPPPKWLGNKVLISQGPPKPINMSKVFAPIALLTVIDPIPVNKQLLQLLQVV